MSGDYFNVTTSSGSTSAAASSRWLTEEVFKLIDMVQRDEAIYNPRHKYYFCRPYVENFWREVDLKLEKNPGASLAKWTNLRISFRREYTNYLEEKVPPCWTYFDRMFFLHPYLRKKQQQPKSLDSQVQDALVQISSLSSRLQCATATNAAAAGSLSASAAGGSSNGLHMKAVQPHQPLDNYLEYIDEPEQHNSELDEIIEEEPQTHFNTETHSLNNDIKSECDDNVDDFDGDTHHENDEQEAIDADIDADTEDADMHRFVLDSLALNSAEQTMHLQQKQQRLQHRLQLRSFHEELRAKRPRSQESCITQLGNNNGNHSQRIVCLSTPTQHTNVSFVRPTFAKPIDYVCTSTASSINHNICNSAHVQQKPNEESGGNGMNMNASITPVSSSVSSTLSFAAASSLGHNHSQATQPGRHMSHHHHHHRLEISAVSSGNTPTAPKMFPDSGNSRVLTPTSSHIELCDCKTDPDAMFLMSLLPDIQKLNGRDRGKIKIAFQNILQDYLYPD